MCLARESSYFTANAYKEKLGLESRLAMFSPKLFNHRNIHDISFYPDIS